jgi:hypothetical protein
MIDRRDLREARYFMKWGEDVVNARNIVARNIPAAETQDGLELLEAALDALEEARNLLNEASLLVSDAADAEEGQTPSEQLSLGASRDEDG